MPAGFYKEVTETLKSHGCYLDRQASGSHELWFSPISGRKFPVSKTLKSRHTANGILKQAGIEKSF